MKKITLSAAILALTMMGCSDTGLDNTVASASTSDVQNEQIKKNTEFPLVLKKVADPVTCGTGVERVWNVQLVIRSIIMALKDCSIHL